MPRKRTSYRSRLNKLIERGEAIRYIQPIENIDPSAPVVFAPRQSGIEQKRKNNHMRQIKHSVEILEKRGHKVLVAPPQTASAYEPYWLGPAMKLAKENNIQIIVAESTDRFVRNKLFKSSDRNRCQLQATELGLKSLCQFTFGFELATLVHPDASPTEVKRFQINRGQQNRLGGRPKTKKPGYKKKRKELNLPIAIQKYGQGTPIAEISKTLNIPRRTVARWVKK